MQEISSKRALVYVALCISLWSLLSVFAKFAQNGLNNYQYLFYSSVVSFLALLAISLYTNKFKELFTYPLKTLLFLSMLGFLDFLFYLLLYFGYKNANGLEVLALQYTWPIFIVLFSVIILKERLTTKKLLSLLLGFFGALLIITKGDLASIDLSNLTTIVVVIISAMSFALFSILSKKVKIEPVNAVMMYFFVSVLYSFVFMSAFSDFVLPNLNEWFFIVINGAFINGVSYIFWVKALQRLDASFIAPFIFLIPIIAAFLLIVFLNEKVYTIYFAGLFFVVLSGVINSVKFRR